MAGTEARTRTAGTLSGNDIGTTITLNAFGWSITGRLSEVAYEDEDAEVTTGVGEPHHRIPIGRWVNITIGPWSGEVSPDVPVSTA